MLEKLIEQGKELIGGELKQEANINESQVEDTMSVAKDSIFDGLKDQVLGGNMTGVMNLFNGKEEVSKSNPIIQSLITRYAGDLIEKLGLPEGTSNTVAKIVIPFIMSKFASEETGKADDENNLMSMLGMDKDNSIMGFLGNFGGNSKKDDDNGGLADTLGKLF